MQTFSQRVLAWFEKYGRKHLPWQQQATLYKTWVSEVMLQQTQVKTVIPYFNRFMRRFPDILTLANASQDDVLAHWAGLGYYSRARNLHKSAQIIRDQYHGLFPNNIEDVTALPGIGRSTAAAILALTLNQRHAILDGNVKRVLSRHQLIDGRPNRSATLKKQWAVAEKLTPQRACGQYTQAMMDLGSLICTRSKPKCRECPVYVDCGAYQSNCIDDYPNKQPKKTLPEKNTTMLIITDDQRIYLEKRPSKGIWGGLWSLPEVSGTTIACFLKRLGLSEDDRQPLDTYTHTFTHYKLHIQPLIIRVNHLNTGFRQTEVKQLGLPKPVQHLISNLHY
ncbi:MAG: A/G-specific adenine glycosylase [Gammaproteobacteria bacterium]|nr:MAG: A/G-specific adenine glycosylase [Gammaproteobacteria bacterium]